MHGQKIWGVQTKSDKLPSFGEARIRTQQFKEQILQQIECLLNDRYSCMHAYFFSLIQILLWHREVILNQRKQVVVLWCNQDSNLNLSRTQSPADWTAANKETS